MTRGTERATRTPRQLSAGSTAMAADESPWRREGTDLVRAASGGLLFGVPLLYTMEVWWTGSHTDPTQMAIVLALGMVPVFLLNLTEGFRAQRDVRVVDALGDTVEAMAVGIVAAAAVLFMIREITRSTPVDSALGKIVYESVPFTLGVGLSRHMLSGGQRPGDDDDGDGDDGHGGGDSGGGRFDDGDGASGGAPGGSRGRRSDAAAAGADIGATFLGAAFIALSIAPTDEVPMIASQITPEWTLVLLVMSLVASYAIVFVAGFTRQERRTAQEGPLQSPITETVASYLLALLVAVMLLWLFQRGAGPWDDLLTRVIVLGFPAAIGGAAGRLAV